MIFSTLFHPPKSKYMNFKVEEAGDRGNLNFHYFNNSLAVHNSYKGREGKGREIIHNYKNWIFWLLTGFFHLNDHNNFAFLTVTNIWLSIHPGVRGKNINHRALIISHHKNKNCFVIMMACKSCLMNIEFTYIHVNKYLKVYVNIYDKVLTMSLYP